MKLSLYRKIRKIWKSPFLRELKSTTLEAGSTEFIINGLELKLAKAVLGLLKSLVRLKQFVTLEKRKEIKNDIQNE